MSNSKIAKKFLVRGRVQGVGFRYFVEHSANSLGLRGYVRNLAEGTVEVYAIGLPEELSTFAEVLRKGPRLAEVQGVDEEPAAVQKCAGFRSY